MEITNFDDLLRVAHTQSEAQRLLFVFVAAELPEDASAEQRAAFEAGHGGALVPRMCVDKLPSEVASFAALVEDAQHTGQEWLMVFAAALGGTLDRAPTSEEARQPLLGMVEAIKQGQIGNFLLFNRQGNPVRLG